MSMTFEDLQAWQTARKLVNMIYSLTRDASLAKDLGLCGQIQRAAVSVMSNVAEGFERTHSAEKLQVYNVARGSCGEVRSLLYVIEDNYRNSAPAVKETRAMVREAGSLVSGLISSTRKRVVAKAGGIVAVITLVVWFSSLALA